MKNFAINMTAFVVAFVLTLVISWNPITAYAAGVEESDSETPATVVTVTRHKGTDGKWLVTSIEASHGGASYAAVSWPTTAGPDAGFTEAEAAQRILSYGGEDAVIHYVETPSADEVLKTADSERMGGIIDVRPRGVANRDDVKRAVEDLSDTVSRALDAICQDDTGVVYATLADDLQAAYKLLDVREVVTVRVGYKSLLEELNSANETLNDRILQAKSAVEASQEPIGHINGFALQIG